MWVIATTERREMDGEGGGTDMGERAGIGDWFKFGNVHPEKEQRLGRKKCRGTVEGY